jgi:hypothetical protein
MEVHECVANEVLSLLALLVQSASTDAEDAIFFF